MNFHEFTKQQFEEICEEAMLDDDLKKIFELKIKGYYNYQIASELNLSDKTINRRIKLLKKKIRQVL